MLTFVDRWLNRITMYRLVMYFLMILVAIAIIFGAVHILPYAPLSLILSSLVILITCWIANTVIANALGAQPNSESVYITALILALIITPVSFHPINYGGIFFLIAASVFAMASKYLLAIKKKHIFNPAAIAVVLTGLLFNQYASWWVGGNLPLLAFVLIGGLLITRKLRHFDLVITFMVAATFSILATRSFMAPLTTIESIFLHTPVFFFAFIMLTEPLTTPPRQALRILYGGVVGLLFAPAIHLGPLYSTPEMALVVGNIFSYAVSPKGKRMFALKEKKEMGTDLYDFSFASDGALKFQPGQYMEWTLGHKGVDGRGNRRYFTIASSPTERELKLGVKYYDPPSSFKKNLLRMEQGDTIMGGQLSGDFTLPKDPRTKLVFIAGGIGITPFRSMVKYLSDQREKRNIVLLYSNRSAEEISYREVFDEAAKTIGLRTVYAITGTGQTFPSDAYRGRIDEKLIAKIVPDRSERMFYISGTHAMVSAMEKLLKDMGIQGDHIKTDFFPGFA
jgi:ferredoxin-NADP reductase